MPPPKFNFSCIGIINLKINYETLKQTKMKNETTTPKTMYRLMNHDSSHTQPRFEMYTLSAHNAEFRTQYNSIDEAIESDPEYLFSHSDMVEFLN